MNGISQRHTARLAWAAGNGPWLLMVAITVAAGLRFYCLDSAPLLPDEAFSIRLAQYPAGEIVQRTGLDVHPPLFYLFLKAWFGAWGTSALTLRIFGAILGIATVPLVYLVCLEAFRRVRSDRTEARRWASLFVSFLFAVHLSQVTTGRFGRMYSLGVLLGGLSAWLLLRALRAKQNQVWWWTGYGVTVAAFCYTHNYALFAAFAQALFCIGEITRRWRSSSLREVQSSLEGFAYASVLALILFAPWLPVLIAQGRTVRGGFWIPELSVLGVGRVFASWGTGLQPSGEWYVWSWLLIFALVVVVALLHVDRAAWFFLLQALVPWALALGISVVSGRPIVMERYMVFAHFFLLGFWGWVWLRLPGAWERAVFSCVVGSMAIAGMAEAAARWPTGRPTIETAAEFLQANWQEGDLVIAPHPIGLNCFRCYVNQAGDHEVDLRTPRASFAGNMLMSHAYALAANDVMEPEYVNRPSVHRIWIAVDGGPTVVTPAPDMERVLERTFDAPGESWYSLILYARKK